MIETQNGTSTSTVARRAHAPDDLPANPMEQEYNRLREELEYSVPDMQKITRCLQGRDRALEAVEALSSVAFEQQEQGVDAPHERVRSRLTLVHRRQRLLERAARPGEVALVEPREPQEGLCSRPEVSESVGREAAPRGLKLRLGVARTPQVNEDLREADAREV
jgi:hypothetical protein